MVNQRLADTVRDFEGGEGFIKNILNSTMRVLEKGKSNAAAARVARAENVWDATEEGKRHRSEMVAGQFEHLSNKALLKDRAASLMEGARSPRTRIRFAQWVLDLEERQRQVDARWRAKLQRFTDDRAAAILKAALFCEPPPLDAFAKYALPPHTRTTQPLLMKFNFPERETKQHVVYSKPPPPSLPHTSGVSVLLREAMERAKESSWPPPPGLTALSHPPPSSGRSSHLKAAQPGRGQGSESAGTGTPHGSLSTVTPTMPLGTPVNFHGSIPAQSFRRPKSTHGSGRQLEILPGPANVTPGQEATPISDALPQRPIRTSQSRDSPRRKWSGRAATSASGSHGNLKPELGKERTASSGSLVLALAGPGPPAGGANSTERGSGGDNAEERAGAGDGQVGGGLPGIAGATLSEFKFPPGPPPPAALLTA